MAQFTINQLCDYTRKVINENIVDAADDLMRLSSVLILICIANGQLLVKCYDIKIVARVLL